MSQSPFVQFFEQAPCILGEGAVIERLRRDTDFELDPHIVNSGFIYERPKKAAIKAIYRQYLDIGAQMDLPLLLSTPTWRASRERIAAAGLEHKDVNGDNFRFLDQLRQGYGKYTPKVIISGLMSCRGDAYQPEMALSTEAAREFHTWQADKLAAAGVDLIMAATLPALSEATGLAAALATTGVPYVISFIFRPEGTLLDGTPLKDAVAAIDDAVSPQPLAYMANCTHVTNFEAALTHADNASSRVRERVAGLLANTAALSPEELDNSTSLVSEDPEAFGKSVGSMHGKFGLKILGGCCGTDDRHIRRLAARIASA
jgi:S-methylmethionine-dependent homocysteine/selenocysteine methylase